MRPIDKSYATRPGASEGWWLCSLVPSCYAATIWRNFQHHQNAHLPQDYKRTVIVTFGLLLHSLVIRGQIQARWNRRQAIVLMSIVAALCSVLLGVCLAENIVFCTFSGFLPVLLYDRTYFSIFSMIPKSFTFGEAFIVVQGIVVFLYGTLLQLPRLIIQQEKDLSDMKIIYSILQVVLLGITTLALATYRIKLLRNSFSFWLATLITGCSVALFPIGRLPTITRLVLFVASDPHTLATMATYMALLLCTVCFIKWQFNNGHRTTTATRKVFHLLIVLVYGPGLWYQCRLLFLASGLMLGLLIVLEMARLIQLSPIAGILNTTVNMFIDEKDAGPVALTPIYLLVGCSLPLWLHPSPCDMTNSAGLQTLLLSAGVLSIGIGDTAASVVGYHLGRHKWSASTSKSVEGTVASVLLQTLAVWGLYETGLVQLTVTKAAYAGIAIIVNALIESRTDQIDNLVLPLVTYFLLTGSS
ncbi:dolichol kinase [Anopheles ziemanni]|uniref:dolichol kinase n=1 Tax=Anopheles coustani TaxID=139045 RepID=UPI0026585323|nr:dolichol kinase [Anopheles coustani]XP_058174132.1 dolichol kinase [Anopheles ziemanni]